MSTEAFERYEQLEKENKLHLVTQMNVIMETEHVLLQFEGWTKEDLIAASSLVYNKYLKVDTDISLSDVAWSVVNEFLTDRGLI